MNINARILLTVLFLIGLTSLRAQNQRLTWVADEYAMRYEVVIEQEEEGEYHSVARNFTEETFIEVSLPAGKYRCQVIPHDFLNQPIPVNEWMDFEVRPSYHESITVDEIPPTEPEPEKAAEYQKQVDIYLSAAWVLLAPFYDENEGVSPFGVGTRFAIVSAKRRPLNPGVELAVSWRFRTLQFDCDMVQQTRFINNKAAFNFRLGMGVSLALGDESLWAAGHYSTHFNIGASFLFLLPKNFFLETSMEYSQLFTQNFACFIRPSIGLGYRF